MRRVCALFFLVTLAVPRTLVLAQSRAAGTGAFRVIVNPQNKAQSVERRFLSDVFLKKVTRWGDGEAIRPVDLGPDSPVRARFADDVMHRSVSAVRNYWQQLVFSGRDVPPPELDTDDEVIAYVVRFPGAVGYVGATVNVDRVRVLPLR